MRVLVCLCLGLLLCACQGSADLKDDLTVAREAQAERNWPLAERLLERILRNEQDADRRWEAWQALIEVINAETREERDTLEFLEVMLLEFAEDDSRSKSILERMGQLNSRMGRYEKAAEVWTSYLDLSGLETRDLAQGYRNLASAQIRMRRFDSAEETLGQCLALPGGERQILYCMHDLADLHASRQNWQSAADLSQQLLENGPEPELRGLTAYLLGDALEQLGKPREAMEQFERARDSYPNPLVIQNRIESLRKKSRKQ